MPKTYSLKDPPFCWCACLAYAARHIGVSLFFVSDDPAIERFNSLFNKERELQDLELPTSEQIEDLEARSHFELAKARYAREGFLADVTAPKLPLPQLAQIFVANLANKLVGEDLRSGVTVWEPRKSELDPEFDAIGVTELDADVEATAEFLDGAGFPQKVVSVEHEPLERKIILAQQPSVRVLAGPADGVLAYVAHSPYRGFDSLPECRQALLLVRQESQGGKRENLYWPGAVAVPIFEISPSQLSTVLFEQGELWRRKLDYRFDDLAYIRDRGVQEVSNLQDGSAT